jgi:hypothetical protein
LRLIDSSITQIQAQGPSRTCNKSKEEERFMCLQGHLAQKKEPPPRSLQWDYVWGPVVALGEGGGSYERGIPVVQAFEVRNSGL